MPGIAPMKSMLAARRAAKKYEAGIMRYQQRLVALNLPARGPAGSAVNYARIGAVARMNHEEKLRRERPRPSAPPSHR